MGPHLELSSICWDQGPSLLERLGGTEERALDLELKDLDSSLCHFGHCSSEFNFYRGCHSHVSHFIKSPYAQMTPCVNSVCRSQSTYYPNLPLGSISNTKKTKTKNKIPNSGPAAWCVTIIAQATFYQSYLFMHLCISAKPEHARLIRLLNFEPPSA